MMNVFRSLDELLRGNRVRSGELGRSGGDAVNVPLRLFVPMAIGLGATYGFFMGWYSISMRWGSGTSGGYLQTLASMVKVPGLFLLTLAVTFPSLYVFSAILGGRVTFGALIRLLVGTVVVSLAVAASFGPILAFFTLSTTSYPFMVVLNVVLLAVGGFVGLGFLRKALKRATEVLPNVADENAQPAEEQSGVIFAIWAMIYGAVGVQMAWLLRPFIGHPGVEFTFFRARSGNFIIGLFESLRHMLGG